MVSLLIKSFTCHLKWWLASFRKKNRAVSPLSFQRLAFLLIGFPLFMAAQTIHGVCLLLDEVLFPNFLKTKIESPVFVLGIPRSGTTYLHRSLAEQSPDLTTFTMWEALLAPSILQRKILRCFGKLDSAIGQPFKRTFDRIVANASGDFNDIHAVGLNAAEEDYLTLLPFGGCFILLLAFPFARPLESLGRLDKMPETEQDKIIECYQAMLQRHLYCHKGKTLLSKNAAFASWGNGLTKAFPSAKFLVCVREPVSALSSQLSSLTSARATFGTDPSGDTTTALFTQLYAHFYESLTSFVKSQPDSKVALIAQTDLRAQPHATISKACTQLGLPTPSHEPEAKPQKKASNHHHTPEDFSLDSKAIQHSMSAHFESMLSSPNRVELDHE